MIGRPWAFWSGVAALSVGVLLHLPDWWATLRMDRAMPELGHRMAMSPTLTAGMALLVVGLAASVYGILPPRAGYRPGHGVEAYLKAMDGAPLRPAHRALALVVGIAIVIDTMKPATLGFVLPGLAAEYGIDTRHAATLPLVALTGTTAGSLAWGMLGDRIGRRASILLSGLLFMATSICGFMPEFRWNLVMCFLMGASAGGMLPIAYALMAESLPADRRGRYIVLQTGLGSVGGYLVAAAAAATLAPYFGWRVLWLLGLPTGLLLIGLNRWIPESPRFLLANGREAEARAVLARYGVTLQISAPAPAVAPSASSGMAGLFRDPYTRHTVIVVGYALSWGLVNWGFITFLPSFLDGAASQVLLLAALLAIPNTFLAAQLYGAWSSKRSMVLYGVVTVVALAGFALYLPNVRVGSQVITIGMLAILLAGTGGMIAMIAPYTTELYPTGMRASGSGLTAGASKVGGMVGPVLIGALATTTPLRLLALLTALPVVGATVALGVNGRETSGKPLPEQIAPTVNRI
ncbi:MAG: MFS transporter [Micromonosporaceae bacterium]